jgi:hypothetical protein
LSSSHRHRNGGHPVAPAAVRRLPIPRRSRQYRGGFALGAGPEPAGDGDRVLGDRLAREKHLAWEAVMPQVVLVVIDMQECLFDAMDAE